MPGLLKLLRKLRKADNDLKLCVLGLDNSGKTTILRAWGESEEDINQIMPTMGFNINEMNMKGFNITAWDLGGQKSIRKYWKNYFDNVDVIVYVVDSADYNRFDESREEMNAVLGNKELAGVPMLVLANKQDLMNAEGKDELFQHLHLSDLSGRTIRMAEVSAKTGDGLQAATEIIISLHQESKSGNHNASATSNLDNFSSAVSGGK